jgi:ElaB/YqjD/DUF883 family membrane-anchored ribosome-binding protein
MERAQSNEQRIQDFSSRVSEMADAAKAKTETIAAATSARAREVTSTVGHKVREFAGKVREKSPHESVRNTTNKVADTLDCAGTYLEEKSFEAMVDDFATIIRRYPLQSVLFGVAIGFMLARRRDSY